MTILFAHPRQHTAERYLYRVNAWYIPERRILSLSLKCGVFDLLRTDTVSECWDWYISLGSLTLAYVGRE